MEYLIGTGIYDVTGPAAELGMLGMAVLGVVIGSLPYVLSEFFSFMDFGGNIGTQPYNLFFVLEPIAFAYGLIKAESAHNDKIAA